jgi:hypothetical protein
MPSPDPFPRSAWLLLATGLFAGVCLLAVGVYQWWQAAQLRPTD